MAAAKDLSKPMKVVILADSRGAGLKYELDCLNNGAFDFVVIIKKGRGIIDLVREVSKRLVWIAPDVIIVTAGICDITEKNRETGLVTLQNVISEDVPALIESSMDTVRHHLSIVLTENPYKLIFGHIVGLDIARYNGQNVIHPQQDRLNDIIIKSNQTITAFNVSNDVPTPWLAKDVHPNNSKKGSKKHLYQKLAPDGLHLSDLMKERWANIIYKLVNKLTG